MGTLTNNAGVEKNDRIITRKCNPERILRLPPLKHRHNRSLVPRSSARASPRCPSSPASRSSRRRSANSALPLDPSDADPSAFPQNTSAPNPTLNDPRAPAAPLLWRGPNATFAASTSAPWSVGWQLNERATKWTTASQHRGVVFFAARALDRDLEDTEKALYSLLALLPALESRVPSIKPQLLAALLRDVKATARKIVQIRVLFPLLDVERALSLRPELLLDTVSVEELRLNVDRFRTALGIGSLSEPSASSSDDDPTFFRMLSEYPIFFEWARTSDMIRECHRLFGSLSTGDLGARVLSDPELLLRCEPSSWLGPSQVFDSDRGVSQD